MTANSSKPSGMRRQPRQARSQERVNQILDVAEQMFIAEGYNATTTNAIASGAKVAIGSLYQFFPDKGAILQALATRYNERLHQHFVELHTPEMVNLPLSTYVDRVIDAVDRFFTDYPGYHAIYMQVQGTMPELEEIESAGDAILIQDLATALSQRDSNLERADCETMAFVLVKAIGTLLWLSLSQEEPFSQRLVAETKRLVLNYLQSYFPDGKISL
ncbi:TetR family transcriptional regulator [Scytonema sp. UIC 10036]|uniref:TetR/AcrR family transcriptional regulator n=1 Tax=Scytonema sp. UIC 10036 TaxID=2304196 RepID=UPI0012DAC394|nr:TetR/AcrR family transcriptional regulator [Scytonema sp. UIC 10036]MUG95618.1 TetR family transcriptional regulator [Scytonema sp. UIC 10036]